MILKHPQILHTTLRSNPRQQLDFIRTKLISENPKVFSTCPPLFLPSILMNSDHISSLRNLSSIKIRFAHRFVRSLKKLSMDRPSSLVSMADRYKRSRMVRAAAYASMASSVGPKRAWARAILRKIRDRKMGSNLMKRRGSRTDLLKKRTVFKPKNNREMGSGKENSLGELVPGGEGMDFCRLLNETGNYIKCLRAQVKVMKNIIDLYSN